MKNIIINLLFILIFGCTFTEDTPKTAEKTDILEQTYTVTYKSDYGTVPSKITGLKKGDKLTDEQLPELTTDGYTFAGWYNGETKVEAGYTITGDLNLTAKWTANTDTAYKIEHYQQNIDNDEYTLAEADTENKTGTTDEDTSATSKDYAGFTAKTIEQMKITADGSTVVKIYYDRKKITLTLDLDGGEGETEITGKYGADVITPANPTKTGYTFAGRNSDLPATFPAENATYTAKWTANVYTVKFDANGGNGNMGNQAFTYDVEKALSANVFTRVGFTFAGWAVSADSEKNYNNNESVKNLTTNFDGKVTLYAQWIANKAGITVILPKDAQINLQQVTNENNVTFTAADGFDSYAWYIDGVKLSETSKIFTIDTSTIDPANYKVMVIVADDDEYYSATADLEVRTN